MSFAEKTSDARYLFRKRASSYVDVIGCAIVSIAVACIT